MHSLVTRFILMGALFGLSFPIIALSLDTYIRGYELEASLFVTLHQENPIHWIIDLAPFILSLTAYYVGMVVQKRERKVRIQLEKELKRSNAVARFSRDLALGKVPILPRLVEQDDDLKKSLTKIKQDIQEIRREKENKSWLESHLYILTELMEKGKHEELAVLMNSLLGKVIRLLGAVAGRIYIAEQPRGSKEYLRVLSSWGGISQEASQERIYSGENAVGQCFRSQKPMGMPLKWVSEDESHDHFSPKLSTAFAYLSPLMLDDYAFKMGVWELDFLKEPPEHHKELIQKLSVRIAFSIWIDREAKSKLKKSA